MKKIFAGHNSDKHSKCFDSYSQMINMMFCQLANGSPYATSATGSNQQQEISTIWEPKEHLQNRLRHIKTNIMTIPYSGNATSVCWYIYDNR
ncbi:MAG: DUF4372 domain-containing protein [Bacteroidales bacterium]|nr:DUF4372 domain-containing protein [Bacteroidales bacterium]